MENEKPGNGKGLRGWIPDFSGMTTGLGKWGMKKAQGEGPLPRLLGGAFFGVGILRLADAEFFLVHYDLLHYHHFAS